MLDGGDVTFERKLPKAGEVAEEENGIGEVEKAVNDDGHCGGSVEISLYPQTLVHLHYLHRKRPNPFDSLIPTIAPIHHQTTQLDVLSPLLERRARKSNGVQGRNRDVKDEGRPLVHLVVAVVLVEGVPWESAEGGGEVETKLVGELGGVFEEGFNVGKGMPNGVVGVEEIRYIEEELMRGVGREHGRGLEEGGSSDERSEDKRVLGFEVSEFGGGVGVGRVEDDVEAVSVGVEVAKGEIPRIVALLRPFDVELLPSRHLLDIKIPPTHHQIAPMTLAIPTPNHAAIWTRQSPPNRRQSTGLDRAHEIGETTH